MLLCIDKYKGSINEALIACCVNEKMDYATTLLEKGADANVPMLQMLDKKDTAYVRLLLAYDANANDPKYINKAIEKNSKDILELKKQRYQTAAIDIRTEKESLNTIAMSGKYFKDPAPYYDPSADEKREKTATIKDTIENMQNGKELNFSEDLYFQ